MTVVEIKKEFIKRFGGDEKDVRVFASPGRVNLIGEHIDYNGGSVLPAAITLGTTIAARPRDDRKLVMEATDLTDHVVVELDKIDELVDFANKLEEACIDTLKDGIMTKDLVGLVVPGTKTTAVNSKDFILAIRERLAAKLA